MNFTDDDAMRLQVTGEPMLPSHITPQMIEDAARKYWASISSTHWTGLEFKDRERVIHHVMRQLAMSWALKEAGIG